MGKTLFDKIWDRHVVKSVKDGPDVLYIDKHLIHEVTSPQAFKGIEDRGLKVFRPKQIVATADHNIPTSNQHLPIEEKLSRHQVDTLTENCKNHNVELYGINHEKQGIIHVISPELGFTQPGMTMVCGDSHTSTHGAFGAVAFGIGTSEVEMVFATQCIMQTKPKTLKIVVTGQLQKGVTAKDLALKVISVVTPAGGAGYFIEFCGEAITSLSMEGRMTLCNMSIEMGARGGLIAPDKKTYTYLKGKPEAPKGDDWTKHKAFWSKLVSDNNASFDKEILLDVSNLAPIITYGTNPGTGIEISSTIPNLLKEANSYKYMNFQPDENMEGKQVDYVFIGSCTNARIEDLRLAASIIKGNKKANHVTAFIVPGSKQVEAQAIQEGLDKIFSDAGFELRQPGCSACLAMNEDKVPAGKYCVSTSNRNFEGRQGPGSRTMLASPLTAAASAIMGKVTDPRTLLN